ncbi:MAG: hypothetical protein HOP15_09195 [Planctomycetes bacterium]|nr:hypothetical protein [Planctomycetota bacterium]
MNIEAFLLCDAATDSQGKLNVLGAFDSFFVNEVPAAHPHCAVVLRLRVDRAEQGEHTITLHLIDEDGKHVIQPLEGRLRVQVTPNQTATSNLILNLQGLKLPRIGELAFHLQIDGKPAGSLPLYIRKLQTVGQG